MSHRHSRGTRFGYEPYQRYFDLILDPLCFSSGTSDVINSMTFSPFGGGPITIDHENIVKVYSVSPSMLGRGHILMEPQGPIWVWFYKTSTSNPHRQYRAYMHQTTILSSQLVRRTAHAVRRTPFGPPVAVALLFVYFP